jgi:hypothetical protein
VLFCGSVARALPMCAHSCCTAKFVDFMQTYKKTYDQSEFAAKYATFKANLDFVSQHDASAKGYTVALNEFGDLTAAEFAAVYNGFRGFVAKAEKIELPAELKVGANALPGMICRPR